MTTKASPTLVNVQCPHCQSRQAVLAFERFDHKSYDCPDCEHVWDEEIPLR